MPDEKSDKSKLIHQRIQQAKESLNEVEILVQNKLFKIAVSRIYYGMFYMLLALALKHNFHTSKHQQLLGWFNKNFINTGEFNISLGRIVNAAYENRSDSDYGIFIEFSEKDIIICKS